jgi:hypothetical protein
MSHPTPTADHATPPAVTNYVLLCLGGLGGVFLAELDRLDSVAGVVTLLALLIGLGGVLARLRLTPVLFLVVLAMGQAFRQLVQGGFGGRALAYVFRPTDLLLCAAGLTFVLGHYRLQGLTRHLLPADPRERLSRPEWDWWTLGRVARLVTHRRSAHLAGGGEFALVALAVLLCVALALAAWVALVQAGEGFGLAPYFGRIVLLGWLLAVGGYATAAVLGYWRRCLMSREQALLVLQDQVWRATRREQRHLNRDAARARRRRSRQKDRP